MISLCKMAAPLAGHGISKQSVNRLIASNLFICTVLLSITYIPANTKGPLDLINNVLPLSLLYSCLIASGQLLFWFSSKGNKNLKLQNVLQGLLIYVAGCLIFHITAILYGAPLTQASYETFHFALLLSTTSVLPVCVVLGPNLQAWARVFAQTNPDIGAESIVYITSISSIAGAWLGAFPIPLDWDRPWQVWPISCVVGTLTGYCVGLLVSAIHLVHKYRILNKMKLT